MEGEMIGFAAVVLVCSIPLAMIYAAYRVRRLKTEERLAAIAKGVPVAIEPELSQAARSRRAGILLVFGAVGYFLTFLVIARIEPDAMIAGAFGIIPFAMGLGYLLDAMLVRRELHPSA